MIRHYWPRRDHAAHFGFGLPRLSLVVGFSSMQPDVLHIVLNGLVPDDGMAGTYFSLGYLFNDQGKLALAEQVYERGAARRVGLLRTRIESNFAIVRVRALDS